jgi:thiol-disulfide isomerase/thioredoxin
MLAILALFWCGTAKIYCLDGSRYEPAEVAYEKGMVVCILPNGGKVILSKALVDWEASGPSIPDLFRQLFPEQAEEVLARAAKHRERPATLGGLAKRWDGSTEEAGPTPSGEASAAPSGPIVQTITGGGEINIKSHLVKGRLTIFDFYADWCGPCRQLSPKLEALVHGKPSRFALKKVDIINWSSPVAEQFGIRSIPHLVVVNDQGETVQSGSGFQVYQVLQGM